jgi:hypothetical protein
MVPKRLFATLSSESDYTDHARARPARGGTEEGIDRRPVQVFFWTMHEPYAPVFNDQVLVRWCDIHASALYRLIIHGMSHFQLGFPRQYSRQQAGTLGRNVEDDENCGGQFGIEIGN